MTSQLTANCCTTKLLRTQFPFSTPDQYKLEVPRVTGIVLEIRLTLRFNSLLNITVISDCKHLHWQTKKKVGKTLLYNNIALEEKMPQKIKRQQKTNLHHV